MFIRMKIMKGLKVIVKSGTRIFKTLYFIGYHESVPCYSLVEIRDNHLFRTDMILLVFSDKLIISDQNYKSQFEVNKNVIFNYDTRI